MKGSGGNRGVVEERRDKGQQGSQGGGGGKKGQGATEETGGGEGREMMLKRGRAESNGVSNNASVLRSMGLDWPIF